MLAISIPVPTSSDTTTAAMVNQLVRPGAASCAAAGLKRAFHFSGVISP